MTDSTPNEAQREKAWRLRHPHVARSPLYDQGWTDALANTDDDDTRRSSSQAGLQTLIPGVTR